MKSKIKDNCLNSDDHRATDSFSSGNQIRKRKANPRYLETIYCEL